MHPLSPPDVIAPKPPHAKSVKEQEADFTSEGAPAPGVPTADAPVRKTIVPFLEGTHDPAQAKDLERELDS
jgi:hypothetical protein